MLLGAVNVFAQDEEVDMTHYIVNAGFDEDMTFTADGQFKEGTVPNAEKETLSARSWSYVHPDGSCFAYTDSRSTNWNGSDGRSWATNGYVAAIKGWECTRTDYPACEWVYFGVLPYDLAEKAIPVADDGTTFQPVPAKPDFANGDDNKGALFLRAGWGGQCSYKQVVKLPCAVYRLEYWSININTNTTSTPTDLTNITCRKDKFTDESGSNLTATEWTKHEFEFTPTSEFTVEFGYKSANAGSGGQAYVFIDGIKLVKIGEADKMELLEADFLDIVDTLYARMDNESMPDVLKEEINDFISDSEEYDTEEECEASINSLKEYVLKVDSAMIEINKYYALTAKAEALLEATEQYPGAAELGVAYEAAVEAFAEATISDYVTIAEQLNSAIFAYYMSQEATMDNPADYTFLVKHPNFVTIDNEPTYNEDGTVTYPMQDQYTTGTAPTLEQGATSEGWYLAGNDGGDRRLNYAQGRVCFNLWANSAGSRSINQDLTNLPAGYYSVSADFITQPSFPYQAHAFAKNSHSDVSSPFLTEGTWTDAEPWGAWTNLKTGTILVADGNLTIGGRTEFPNADATGWFCITNVKLFYHGPIDFEDYKKLYDEKIVALEAMCDTMVYAADKAAFADSIAAAKGATTSDEITEKLAALGRAQATAQASIDKWIGVSTGSWANLKDSIAAGVYSTDGIKVAQQIVDIMTSLIYAEDATYTTMDARTAVLRKYRDAYLPALVNAESKVYTVSAATEVLKANIEGQVAELCAITVMPTEAVMDAYVANLNAAIAEADRLEVAGSVKVEAGADLTGLIVNPQIASAAAGWDVNIVTGDGNGAKTGQQFDGDGAGFYIDSYNSVAGNLAVTISQTLENVPNGTYEVKAMTRTSGEGAYLYAIADADTLNGVFAQMSIHEPYNYTQNIDPSVVNYEGGDSIMAGQDVFGPIWQESVNWVLANIEGMTLKVNPDTGEGIAGLIDEYKLNNEGSISDDVMYHLNVVAANNGLGRGWSWTTLQVEVKDHNLTIGVTTDSTFTAGHKNLAGDDCVPFVGTWFSGDNFELKLLTPGNNDGWNPLATGIESVVTPENIPVSVKDGVIVANGAIYSISGARVANGTKVPAGVYIVRQGKAATKVVVK